MLLIPQRKLYTGDVKPEVKDTITHVHPDGSFDTVYFGLTKKAEANYAITKTRISSERLKYWQSYNTMPNDSAKQELVKRAGKHLESGLINHIIPFWYGTPWSFEGHTSKPGVGEVACGYFVSTTLQHTGVSINRYKLAQQAPLEEALTVGVDSVIRFTGISKSDFRDTMLKSQPEGLYFIGLYNHVGYGLIRKGELFFIHSNYIGSSGVTVEPALYSQALESSVYYVSPITTNERLVLKWLLNEEVAVVTQK